MGLAEGLLIVAIVCGIAFLVLRPDRFGRSSRGDGGGDSGTGYYGSDSSHSHDLTGDNAGGEGGGDNGGDGGGDGGGGD